jgi:hypothetical protein
MSRHTYAIGATAAALGLLWPAGAANAAPTYDVTVTCTVPKRQPERQLAPNHCLNYLPDGTQTYIAKVADSNGRPVAGVKVYWSDDSASAKFRVRKNPCTTGSDGRCSNELVVRNPRRDMVIRVTGTVGSSSAVGYLSFR